MKPVTLKQVEGAIVKLQSAQYAVKAGPHRRAVQSAITVLSRVKLEKQKKKPSVG